MREEISCPHCGETITRPLGFPVTSCPHCHWMIAINPTHPATPERRFPILGTTFSIPWSLVGPHELQAQRNHYQTLERLAERGGVDSLEALYIILDEKWEPGHLPITSARVAQKILERWCDLREVK